MRLCLTVPSAALALVASPAVVAPLGLSTIDVMEVVGAVVPRAYLDAALVLIAIVVVALHVVGVVDQSVVVPAVFKGSAVLRVLCVVYVAVGVGGAARHIYHSGHHVDSG